MFVHAMRHKQHKRQRTEQLTHHNSSEARDNDPDRGHRGRSLRNPAHEGSDREMDARDLPLNG